MQLAEKLTKRLTPQSGRTSRAELMNSFPYFAAKCLRISISSGKSAHLGDAKITLDTASFRSMGQLLQTSSNTIEAQKRFKKKIMFI